MGIFRDRPSPQVDNLNGGPPSRSARYSEAYTVPMTLKELAAADEGSYFVGITPTPGTGIIGHAAPTTFDETKPYLLLYNGGQNRIYPQFLYLYETVVSVLNTRTQFTFVVDQGNRFSSGGTALTKNNVNMDSVVTTQATITVGAVTAIAASSSRRVLGHWTLRGTIGVVEDRYQFVFGDPSAGQYGSRVATVADLTVPVSPVVVGPGQSFLVHQWSPSQTTGPTFEVILGYIER